MSHGGDKPRNTVKYSLQIVRKNVVVGRNMNSRQFL